MYQSWLNQLRVARQDRASRGNRRKRWQKLAPPAVGIETLEKRRLLTGDITGKIFNDVNQNGVDEPEENGLAGWTLFIDTNGDGNLTPGEPTRVTDIDGRYEFLGLPDGLTTIYEIPQDGFAPTPGFTDHQTVEVRDRKTERVKFPNFIPTVPAGDVVGTVFDDLNQNRTREPGENGLAGWTIFVDTNGDGTLTAGEPTTLSDSDGDYIFVGLTPGLITIYEIPQGFYFPSPGTLDHQDATVVDGGTIRANFANYIPQIGNIAGNVWNDANGDGIHVVAELGLSGWTVFLDLDANGVLDPGELSTVTDANGHYEFLNVDSGPYRVVEIVEPGWEVTRGTPSARNVTVFTAFTTTANFNNLIPVDGSVSGSIWEDLDGNGLVSGAELGLSGWEVFADLNGNSLLDVGEPSATTDANGDYTIVGKMYGTFTVREILQTDWTPTVPATGARSVNILNGGSISGITFGNRLPAEAIISGVAFNDRNKDGVRDPGEPGLSGITVYLDINDNGHLDAGEPSAVTSIDLYYTPGVDEAGTYSFAHLPKGTYHVREILTDVFSATPAAVQHQIVTLGPVDQTNIDFANRFRPSEIHGIIFDDADGDHVRDSWEAVRPGVTVYIDLNRDDVYDVGEPTTISGVDGSYHFYELEYGSYVVRSVLDPDHEHTYPQTGGGILWPAGVSNPAIGNVTPGNITTSLAKDESYFQTVSLTLPNSGGITNMVDVFLLFDDTGSFTANSPIVRAAFPTIISTLQTALPGIDLGFGVGRFEEYANFASEFSTGRPFILNQPIITSGTTGFSTSIQAALDRTAPGFGGDAPETDIEALFQLVTGLGFDGNNNGSFLDSGPAGLASTQLTPGNSGDVPNFGSFTADPANNVLPAAGTIGGAGFRPGALPIILTATDTGFAYQPKGETSITGVGGLTLPLSQLTQASRGTTPFNYGAGIQETVTGLNALGALVIGLGTNPQATLDPRQGLEALASLTGSINRSTTTIANGTADPIAPGDPFYFQISSGFGGTVADGVINAIQNAVTNVAMDITVRASDPRVRIINHSPTALGVGAGETATFDVEFIGDGKPHRFDLQFIREGTNVVLGSIPVVLGTPIVGEGYEFEDLDEGEIEYEEEFGHHSLLPNAAPVLDASGNPALDSIQVNMPNAANIGTLVSDIIARMGPTGGITDADLSHQSGIAIVGLTGTANGTWQFTIDDGATWAPIGTTGNANARLLASDSATRVRFVPNVGFKGLAKIAFVAWDQTAGVNGGTLAAGTRGGSTPFSATYDYADLNVTNAAPVLNAAGTPTFDPIQVNIADANNVGTLVSDLISRMGPAGGITDADLGALQGIAIIGLTGTTNGTWQFTIDNGTTWAPIGTTGNANARLLAADPDTRIRFIPNAGFKGLVKIAFVAWDRTAGVNGGTLAAGTRGGSTAFSSVYEYADLNVTNAAPVLNAAGTPTFDAIPVNVLDVNNPGTLVSDLIARMGPAGGITDTDLGALQGIAIIGLTGTTNGNWQFTIDNGTTWAPIGTTGNANARLLAADPDTRVRFVPNAGFKGLVKIAFVAWDRTAGVNGGILAAGTRGGSTPFSAVYDYADLNVTNAAPVLNNIGTPTFDAIQMDVVDSSNVGTSISDLIARMGPVGGITDADPGALQGIAIVGLTGVANGTWQYTIDGGANWAAVGTTGNSNARLLAADPGTRIRFVPNPGYSGQEKIAFVAWDRTSGVNGGIFGTGTRGGSTAFSLAWEYAALDILFSGPPLV